MSKKPALPAELMARHLDYRTARPQQAAWLTARQRFADQQHHEALRIVRRIEQRQEVERLIRDSRDWMRPPGDQAPSRARGILPMAAAVAASVMIGGLAVVLGRVIG
jgi:hypothetical protein